MLARAEPTHASMGGGARRRQNRRQERKGELFARSLSLQEDGAAIFVKQPRSGGRHPKPNHRSRLSLSRCLRARSRPTHLWEAERVADSIEDRRGKANWFARSLPPQEASITKKAAAFMAAALSVTMFNFAVDRSEPAALQDLFRFFRVVADTEDYVLSGGLDDRGVELCHLAGVVALVEV